MPDILTDRQRKFVEQPRIGRLATTMRDGSPHISPVWYRFDAGDFLVLCERTSVKARNVGRDPRVAFCIDDDRPPYHAVLVRGRVTVEDAPGREWRLALAIHYLGEENGRRYIETSMHPNNVMLRITPEKVRGW
jgi:PPOX class probable F420-dependent enzyme